MFKRLLVIAACLLALYVMRDRVREFIDGLIPTVVYVQGTPVIQPTYDTPTLAPPAYEVPTYEAYVTPTPEGVYGPPVPPNYQATEAAFWESIQQTPIPTQNDTYGPPVPPNYQATEQAFWESIGQTPLPPNCYYAQSGVVCQGE